MRYVFGDIHGSFKTLIDLKNKLPKESELIFVGDLIDRGKYSKDVIQFVRENNCLCTLGNHEQMMIEHGEIFLKTIDNPATNYIHMWLNSGGKETLLSYNLITIENGRVLYSGDDTFLKQFEDDIKWLKTLPLYIKLDEKINNRDVVISHSCISNVWDKKDDIDFADEFEEYALWHRDDAFTDNEIFNIFGHTPTPFGVDLKEHYLNLDTGCYIDDIDHGKLSTFCIETQEVISINRNKED